MRRGNDGAWLETEAVARKERQERHLPLMLSSMLAASSSKPAETEGGTVTKYGRRLADGTLDY